MHQIRLIIATALWGTVGFFVLKSGLSPNVIAFFRCLFGFGLLFLIKPSLLISFKKFNAKDLFLTFISGSFVVINWLMLFKAFQLTTITIASSIYYTQPIFLVLISIFFLKEKISATHWFFILISFLGVVLILNPNIHNLYQKETLSGIGYALGASIAYAIATIFAKKLKHIPSTNMTMMQLLIGFIALLPFASVNVWQFTLLQWTCLLTMAAVHSVLAFLLFYHSVKFVPISQVAVITYVSPLVAFAIDILYFHNQLVFEQWLGVVAILWSGYKISTRKLQIQQEVDQTNYKLKTIS